MFSCIGPTRDSRSNPSELAEVHVTAGIATAVQQVSYLLHIMLITYPLYVFFSSKADKPFHIEIGGNSPGLLPRKKTSYSPYFDQDNQVAKESYLPRLINRHFKHFDLLSYNFGISGKPYYNYKEAQGQPYKNLSKAKVVELSESPTVFQNYQSFRPGTFLTGANRPKSPRVSISQSSYYQIGQMRSISLI